MRRLRVRQTPFKKNGTTENRFNGVIPHLFRLRHSRRQNVSSRQINVTTCFLCRRNTTSESDNPTSGLSEWELIWLRKCSESLANLLDVEGFSSSFFEKGFYCTKCMNLIREIDFTLRTATSLQTRLSKFRTQIAKFVLSGLDNSLCTAERVSQKTFVQAPLLNLKSESMEVDEAISDNENVSCFQEFVSSAPTDALPQSLSETQFELEQDEAPNLQQCQDAMQNSERDKNSDSRSKIPRKRKMLSRRSCKSLRNRIPYAENSEEERDNESNSVQKSYSTHPPRISSNRPRNRVSYAENSEEELDNESNSVQKSYSTVPPRISSKRLRNRISYAENSEEEIDDEHNFVPEPEGSVSPANRVAINNTKKMASLLSEFEDNFITQTDSDNENANNEDCYSEVDDNLVQNYATSTTELSKILKVKLSAPKTYEKSKTNSIANTQGYSCHIQQEIETSDSQLLSDNEKRQKILKLSERDFITEMQTDFDYWEKTEQENVLTEFVQSVVRAQDQGHDQDQLQGHDQGQYTDFYFAEIEGETYESLLVHLMYLEIEEYHQKTKPYICSSPYCGARFGRIADLQRHKIREECDVLVVTPFQCFICDMRLSTNISYDMHFRRVHELDPRPCHCELCHRKFKVSSELTNHLSTAHKKLPNLVEVSSHKDYSYNPKGTMKFRRVRTLEIIRSTQRTRTLPKLSENAFLTKMKNDAYYWRRTDTNFILKKFVETNFENSNNIEIGGKSQASLLIHLLRSEIEEFHQTARTYVCTAKTCGARFFNLRHLQNHKRFEHGKHLQTSPFQCFMCDVRLPSEMAYDIHFRRVHEHDRRPFHCEIPGCEKKFTKSSHFGRHMSMSHRDVHVPYMATRSLHQKYRDKVAMCTDAYRSRQLRKARHSKTPKTFACPVEGCNYMAVSQQLITLHNNKVHEKKSRPYECTTCGKDYPALKAYREHKCMLLDREKHQCEHCGKTFAIPFRLKMHIRRFHKEFLTLKCSICHFAYSRPEELERHEKLHLPNVFNCVVGGCPNSEFGTLEELQAHVTGPFHDATKKTRVCEICGYVTKGFAATQRMQLHMRVHTGESPYKCRHCDKRFKFMQLRSTHEQIYHPDLVKKQIFACKQCDATFTVAQYLYKHNAWHKYGSNACLPIARKRYY